MQDAPPDAIDPSLVRRVLVTKLRHHGDVLLASPVFTVLRAASPAAEIDALVYRETAPMLEGHPAHRRAAHDRPRLESAGLGAQGAPRRACCAQLRARRYDLIVHLTEHPRGAWLARLLAPRYAVGARAAARALAVAHELHALSTGCRGRRPRHAVECNLDALRRIGLQPARRTSGWCSSRREADGARARAMLAQHGLEARRFIQMHPGSRWLFKCWPAEASPR